MGGLESLIHFICTLHLGLLMVAKREQWERLGNAQSSPWDR